MLCCSNSFDMHMVLLVSGYMPSAQQLLLYSLEHQSFLFNVRHNMDLPLPLFANAWP